MYRLRLNRCVQAYRLKDRGRRCSRKLWQTIFELSRCRDSFAQGGLTMRDCSNDRAGFDRVPMAVAATFLAVAATTAWPRPIRRATSAAELAIDAAVPRPEPANVPPPTAGDFKLDATAAVPRQARSNAEPPLRTHPIRSPPRPLRPRLLHRRRRRSPEERHRRRRRPRTATPRRACDRAAPPPSRRRPRAPCQPADQPVADKITRTCSRRRRCAISTARTNAPPPKTSTRRAATRRSGSQNGAADRAPRASSPG